MAESLNGEYFLAIILGRLATDPEKTAIELRRTLRVKYSGGYFDLHRRYVVDDETLSGFERDKKTGDLKIPKSHLVKIAKAQMNAIKREKRRSLSEDEAERKAESILAELDKEEEN